MAEFLRADAYCGACELGPEQHMGGCQNYGPFLGPYYSTGPNTGPNLGDPKRDHNFDNPPYVRIGTLNPKLEFLSPRP